ncbi:hypothetical protein Tmel_0791 [Thermosipho melanesiensis BI429]|uniref:Uncharacterized protein n=1 Tax=Thermosipho melanesiensis (strain DSM 12029 / CIP 104789 / BI429) TaxID=391009 RepID=A6LL52_THEM4|nr:hypothetical protein Tmel_0791 [Thermosipho melanesiensis BI429]
MLLGFKEEVLAKEFRKYLNLIMEFGEYNNFFKKYYKISYDKYLKILED